LEVLLVEDGIVVLAEDLVVGEVFTLQEIDLSPLCIVSSGFLHDSYINEAEFGCSSWRQKGINFLLEGELIDFWIGIRAT
jgi:hypothetical protein